MPVDELLKKLEIEDTDDIQKTATKKKILDYETLNQLVATAFINAVKNSKKPVISIKIPFSVIRELCSNKQITKGIFNAIRKTYNKYASEIPTGTGIAKIAQLISSKNPNIKIDSVYVSISTKDQMVTFNIKYSKHNKK